MYTKISACGYLIYIYFVWDCTSDPKYQEAQTSKFLKTLYQNHFTEKSFHRKKITERQFDRNTIWPNTVWRNAIWPKHHSIESPFDRKFILPKGHMIDFFSENDHSFDKKCHLTEKKMRTGSFDRKFIWPKVHSTGSVFFEKWSFDRMFLFEKLSFSKNCHLTDCSYSIRIVHVLNFFVAARRRERKKLFLYCHYYYSNRVENMI
jgi:hypothetical protein